MVGGEGTITSGGAESPPDVLTSELGLKEGQEGASPIPERVYYQHCRTSWESWACEGNKSSGSHPGGGAGAVRFTEAVVQGKALERAQLCSLHRVPRTVCAQEVFN